jgi:signal transduction histidine kinase
VPRSTALALTDRVRNDLWLLFGVVLVGFGLVGVVIQRGPIRAIKGVARQANAIAEGDLSVDIEARDRLDEVGQVQSAFSNTKAYIETITGQADALSRREFDNPVLDEEIPGRVGESMQTMQQDLRTFISRLEVFNRVLRHNLRNQLDIIDSHAEAVADEGETDHAEAILDATDRLAGLGTRARRIDRLMSSELEPESLDLTATITSVLDDIETAEHAVTLNTDLPETAPLVSNPEALSTVLRSPLENAVRYAETAVKVSVEAEADGYTVEIHDDGPGIPEAELSALGEEREPQLQHGRGLGLWQLKWGVAELGGEFSITTDDGTTVRIQLPNLDET